MRGYALINESSEQALTADVMQSHAQAMQDQQAELADWWERRPLPVSVASNEREVPTDAGIILATYVDTLDDPNALAYHTLDQYGRPRIYIGVGIVLANGGSLSGPNGLSCAASHELCETTCDPYCGALYVLPDGSALTPLEVCDWTQGDSYQQRNGTYVSNFCGPRSFDAIGTAGPFDRMALMTGPFQLRTGGYRSELSISAGGAWTDVFGARADMGGMPEWMRLAKQALGTRRTTRQTRWVR